MKLFNCLVRLGGSVLHEVPKYDVTDMEIRVLQSIHGSDAVTRIKTAGEVKRTDKEEASRLADEYGGKRVEEATGIKDIAPLVVDVDDDEDEVKVPAKAPEASNSGSKALE